MRTQSIRTRFSLLATGLALAACQSKSYTASLSLSGVDNQNDVSVSVQRLLEAQTEAEQAFVDAFGRVTRFTSQEGELDLRPFDELLDRVDLCAKHVAGQEPHVLNFEAAGRQLFSSWDAELAQFSSVRLRERSEARMNTVRVRYEQLMVQAVETSAQLEQALVALRDYVLFFNHNLTPEAISGLRHESDGFDEVILSLRTAVAASREASDAFTMALHGVPVMGQPEPVQ